MTNETTTSTTKPNKPIMTLTMENGVEKDFEVLNILEHNGKQYAALSEPNSEEYDVIEIVATGNEELQIAVIVDDEEYETIASKFDELFAAQDASQ